MKKLLLIIALLICQVAIGQKNVSIISPTRYAGEGTPYFKKNVPARALYINYLNDSVYQFARWNDLNGRWNLCTDIKAINDIRGGVGVKGEKGDTGPQGVKGDKGDPGVCPDCPPSGGVSTSIYYIITNGVDDWAAIQRAVDSSYVTGIPIQLNGYLKLSKGIKIEKDHRMPHIKGMALIQATNSNVWTFFYSDPPANVAEAEGVYAFRKITFENLILQGRGQAQTGFDLHASEGAVYNHIWCYDMKVGFNLSFALRSWVNMSEANCCIDGLVIQSGVGRYVDNTNNNTSTSCSNGTKVDNFRAYACSNTSSGIKVMDASLVKVDGLVLEGDRFNIGADMQSMSSTSTGAWLERVHFEAKYPATVSAIKIRSSTMNHYISNSNLIKPSMFITLENGGAGYPHLLIDNMSNQRVYFNGTSKIFTNSGGNWTFRKCDNPFTTIDIPKMFNGTISQGCGTGAGSNKWCIENPINR